MEIQIRKLKALQSALYLLQLLSEKPGLGSRPPQTRKLWAFRGVNIKIFSDLERLTSISSRASLRRKKTQYLYNTANNITVMKTLL